MTLRRSEFAILEMCADCDAMKESACSVFVFEVNYTSVGLFIYEYYVDWWCACYGTERNCGNVFVLS